MSNLWLPSHLKQKYQKWTFLFVKLAEVLWLRACCQFTYLGVGTCSCSAAICVYSDMLLLCRKARIQQCQKFSFPILLVVRRSKQTDIAVVTNLVVATWSSQSNKVTRIYQLWDLICVRIFSAKRLKVVRSFFNFTFSIAWRWAALVTSRCPQNCFSRINASIKVPSRPLRTCTR